MKRFLYVLPFILFFSLQAKASPGDTTWVQAHNDQWLDYYNNFDTTVTFPDGSVSYRKIYMIFTLGKYVCPGSPTYCGDWDYTVLNYLMTPGGDTLELGRLITPYANSSYPSTPDTFKKTYTYDVTDFYPVLKNSATMRILYSGYSGGFTANIKFAFIEGTRERDVTAITRLWHGSWSFGNAGDPINNHLATMGYTVPAGTVSEAIHLNITGHGSDDNGCGEFCKKHYSVYHNGIVTETKDIWRDDCGSNQLYPQSGTWIYDRANWCPGALVHTNIHEFAATAATQDSVDVQLEDYTNTGAASYTIEGVLISYAARNKTVDASLDAIVSPTDDRTYFRENSACSNPTVIVSNTGSTPITAMHFDYGLTSAALVGYDWTGSIAPGASATIELPNEWALRTATGTNTFSVTIASVNGLADEDMHNDHMESIATAPALWNTDIIIKTKTNLNVNGAGFSETSWQILDEAGTVVASHTNMASNTLFRDTLSLPPNCYRLVVVDEGCDGLSWWANAAGGSGYIRVSNLGSTATLPMNHYFNADFGCGFTQYFRTDWPTAVNHVSAMDPSLEVFPNPATDQLNIALEGFLNYSGTVSVINAMGSVVMMQKMESASATFRISDLPSGIYHVIYQAKDGQKVSTKLSIIR